ncbi:MAG: LysM peptidoglycan-binding domain-containing protein [Anaerolineales bacterium]|nr:LysM peptidoglycan-binding domain-containing protein [Anaerolineales bacterium]
MRWLVLFFMLMGMVPVVMAQEGGSTPPPTTTIHVVQRGDTLFTIAQLYGTTVEAIMTANNLSDARFIEVGQRLLIPNARPGINPNTNLPHVVQPGETLYTLDSQYPASLDELMLLNHVVHPRRLYVGQVILVGDATRTDETFSLYVVQAGDYPLRIAARFGLTLERLRQLNGLDEWTPIVPGMTLLVPKQAKPLLNLPTPLTNLTLNPTIPAQGQSVSLKMETSVPIQATIEFMERTYQVGTIDPTHYAAILSIHAFADAGVYPIRLNLLGEHPTTYELRIEVQDGGYGSEAIDFPADREYLLEASVVQPELDRVIAVVTPFTPQRYFDGLMSLPAASTMTSPFGTRRSYDGSPYNTFHGGADFGGAVGTPITAPAGGVVVFAEATQVRGNAVIIDHGWGVYTGYWHQSEIFVQVGQTVNRGDTIGTLGGTGLATGPHLHWEMWVNGVQVDPMQWVQQAFP